MRFSSSCTFPTVIESGAAKGILNAAILSAADNFVNLSMYNGSPPDIANDFFLYLKLEIKSAGAIGAVMDAIAQSVKSSGRDIVVGELEGRSVGQQFIDAYGEGYLIFIFYESSSVQFENLQELEELIVDVQQTFRVYMLTPGPVLRPPCFTHPATTMAATTIAATTKAAADPCTVYLANGSTINACGVDNDQEVYIKSRTYDGIGYPRMVDYGVLYPLEPRSENSVRALSVKPCDFGACRWKLRKRANGNVAILNADGDTLKVMYENGPITQVTTEPDRANLPPDECCQEFTLRYTDNNLDGGYTISIPDGYPHAGTQIGLEPGATADGDPDDPGGVPVVYAIEDPNFPNIWAFETDNTPTTTRAATTKAATTKAATTKAATQPPTQPPAAVTKFVTVFYSECNRINPSQFDAISLIDEGVLNALQGYASRQIYGNSSPKVGDLELYLNANIRFETNVLNTILLAIESAARRAGIDPRIKVHQFLPGINNTQIGYIQVTFFPKSKVSITSSVRTSDADYVGAFFKETTSVMELYDGPKNGGPNAIITPCEPRTSLVRLVRGSSVPPFQANSTNKWPAPQFINGGLRFTGIGGSEGNWLAFPTYTIEMKNGFTFVAAFRFAKSAPWQRVFDFGNGPGDKNILLTQRENEAILRFGIHDNGAESYCEVPIEFGKVLVAWGWYDATLPGMTLRVDNAGAVSTGRLYAPKIIDKRTLTRNYVGKSNWDGDSYSNMDLFHLRIFNEFINEGTRQTQLVQYAKDEAAAISPGMAVQAPQTPAPTQPPETEPPVTQPPRNVAPQNCEISLYLDANTIFGGQKETVVFADVCSMDKTYQFWPASANSVLRYNKTGQNIVVSPSYDPTRPTTDLFRFYSPGAGSSVEIRNDAAQAASSFVTNIVYAEMGGVDLWGGFTGFPPWGDIISRFYIRQLPGSAQKPRSNGNSGATEIARVAIEADLTTCFSEGCVNANGNDGFARFIRYFVAVENGKALVVATTATEDKLPDKFVFYVAEDFGNYYDNIEGVGSVTGACSIL